MDTLEYGIEEEVYIIQTGRPTLESLYCLASLLWKKGFFNYSHTAINFAHPSDLRTGIVGGVEVSTEICPDTGAALNALMRRRRELSETASGFIVPMGGLFGMDAPTRTCGMHVHIGGVSDMDKTYYNLAHFLPLLALVTANSPFENGNGIGKSYRIGRCPFIGPVNGDPMYRFQDIIISRRLGTLEIRIFDAVWDAGRIEKLMGIIRDIVTSGRSFDYDPEFYKSAREEAAYYGYGPMTGELFRELSEFCDAEEELFARTPAESLYEHFASFGSESAYSALDNAYRNGVFEPDRTDSRSPSPVKIGIGIMGYFLPKIPYSIWKTCRELGL